MPKLLKTSKRKACAYIRQWAGKKTIYEIACDLNVAQGTVIKYAFEMEISLGRGARRKKHNHREKSIEDIVNERAKFNVSSRENWLI